MSILDRNLEECQAFDEISQWRSEKYKIDKKSGDDYTSILTNIYKEPTHFIYTARAAYGAAGVGGGGCVGGSGYTLQNTIDLAKCSLQIQQKTPALKPESQIGRYLTSKTHHKHKVLELHFQKYRQTFQL